MKTLHRRGFLAAGLAVTATAGTSIRALEAPATRLPEHLPQLKQASMVLTGPQVSIPVTLQADTSLSFETVTPAPVAPAPPSTIPATAAQPRWQRYAVARPANIERPAITIVIDDLGVMHAATERVLAMPAPLTLSWFPFAPNLPNWIANAEARGHEATLHMPMQSFGLTTAWTGPDPLRIDLPPAVNIARLRAAIAAVPNTVGLNNHMGSVATRDAALMAIVAQECKSHDMLFLDSLVISHSVGYSSAHDIGVPAASRDIFIDHTNKPEDIRFQLLQIEQQARRNGHVIAIGHPWPHTVAALEEWLPTLQGKGFSLWPLSATVARLNDIRMNVVHV